MMKKQVTIRKNLILATLFLIILYFTLIKSSNSSTDSALINNERSYFSLRTATFWNLTGSSIFINDMDPNYNWSKTEIENDWCNGVGTWYDPYIIENVTINGLAASNCIEIINSNVSFIIRNCTLINSGSNNAGIKLINVNNSKITSNEKIYSNDYGVFLYGSCYNNSIEKNVVSNNNRDGIKFQNLCAFNQISQNEIYNNQNGIGLYNDCFNNTILNNYAHDNKYNGLILMDSCTNNTIRQNDIIENDDINIMLRNECNENFLEGNYIQRAPFDGIFLDESHYNVIKNNTILDNYFAWSGLKSSGIDLDNSEFNLIVNNSIRNIAKLGIYLEWHSDSNSIINNTISNCEWGIWSIENSNFLNITNNLISNCEIGIRMNLGTANSKIYNNIFINDVNAIDYGNNQWHYNGTGNYWSDYTGIDGDDDGIGDTAHNISTGIDLYPLWWDAPEFNILSPLNLNVFLDNIPNFTINITHGIIDKMWYDLDYSKSYMISNTSGSIDTELWNQSSDGLKTLTFHVNDSKGYISSKSVIIEKQSTSEPPEDPLDDPPEDPPGIIGYPFIFIIIMISIGLIISLRKTHIHTIKYS